MKNKYYFFKKLFKEYVIVFEVNNKYKSYGIDKVMMKYLRDGSVNYIIVFHDFKIKKYEVSNNNYYKLLLDVMVFNVILTKY